jgi:hypothetical protein
MCVYAWEDQAYKCSVCFVIQPTIVCLYTPADSVAVRGTVLDSSCSSSAYAAVSDQASHGSITQYYYH